MLKVGEDTYTRPLSSIYCLLVSINLSLIFLLSFNHIINMFLFEDFSPFLFLILVCY